MMRKFVFIFSFLIIHIFSYAQNASIDALRNEYCKVNSDSSGCAKLYQKISKTSSTNNIINGYKGSIIASMANYTKSKEDKLKLFKSGKILLEQSISKDSSNIELRFLRFTIQTNCPKVLGYNKQIQTDKKFIINNFSSIKITSLKNNISAFLLRSNFLTPEEKQKIKN
jgi:hypothetical protein